MSSITRKTEIEPIDGTPVKRMFWSIISDYNLRTGLCELVDNALDPWMTGSRRKPLKIATTLDVDRQLILITDNAGGLKQDELQLLVAPGGSRNRPDAEVIGIFGVGSKRAGIALGEQVVIKTRFRKERTFEIDITRDWLDAEGWVLPAYEIPPIEPGTTQVEVSRLRQAFAQQDIDELADHLGETYAWFMGAGCVIEVNGTKVSPRTFDAWAFPPGFAPRSTAFDADLGPSGKIAVAITAGLIRDRIPQADNYGVYFYCNHRLIVKELRTREVGYFVTSEAGVPHPDASLCRVIVNLQGGAQLMPWNSSKSGINFNHPAFHQVRPTVIQLVSHFSKLSRRVKNDWDRRVFRYTTGQVEGIEAEAVTGKRLVLPSLPHVRRARAEQLKSRNRRQIHNNPWTLGLVEAMAAVDIITRQRLETRNRIALILLDSNFEIALKEFIVHRNDLFPLQQFGNAAIQKLFQNRNAVIAAVTRHVRISTTLLAKAQHYYSLRNKLIHERATVGLTDAEVNDYRSAIEKILTILFKLRFTRD